MDNANLLMDGKMKCERTSFGYLSALDKMVLEDNNLSIYEHELFA